ncbi:MAG: hypothetical protein AAGK32_11465, partial [Actinomycetota bacterium]
MSATVAKARAWQRIFGINAELTLIAGVLTALFVAMGAVHAGLLWAHQSGFGWFGVVAIGVAAGIGGLVVAVLLLALIAATLPDDTAPAAPPPAATPDGGP